LHGDEAIYVSVADLATRADHWAPLSLGESNFVAKPPLAIWMIGLGTRLLGDHEAAYRAAGALAGWMVCFATLRLGSALASTGAGALAAILLASSPNLLHLHGLRSAVTEPWLLLAVTASFLVAAVQRGHRRLVALACLSILNGLAKGLFGLAIVAGASMAAATWLAIESRRSARATERSAEDGAGAVLAAALVPGALAFYGWLHLSLGSWQAIRGHLSRDVVDRVLVGVDAGHLNPPGLYAVTLWTDFGPWLLFAAAALTAGLGFRGDAEAGRSGRILCGSWLAVTAVLVLFSSSRLAWYLYPAYPAVALAAGAGWSGLWARASERRSQRAVLIAAMVALLGWRAVALATTWPKPETLTIAELARIAKLDPGARILVDENLFRGAAGGRVRQWNAFYLRRFERAAPGRIPGDRADCRFLVTARPAAWEADPSMAGGRRVEIERAAEADARLHVIDLCGGRFAGTGSTGDPG